MIVVTIIGILTSIIILVSHICFIRARQAQNITNTQLVCVSPFGLKGSFCALVFCCLITLTNGFPAFVSANGTSAASSRGIDWPNFIVDYIPIPIYLAMILGYKYKTGSRKVVPRYADLFRGKERIDREEEEFLEGERVKRGGRGESEGKWERLYRRTLGALF